MPMFAATVRRPLIAAALTTAAMLAVAGCKNNADMSNSQPSTADTPGMSKDQLMQRAQDMISKGTATQDSAAAMPDGPDKQSMMDKAKQMIQQGEALMDKAKAM